MNFFIDENIPKICTDFLLSKGHSVIDIRGTNYEGTRDGAIFKMAQNEKAIFITTDKDFFHKIPHLYEFHFGVVVINLRQPNRRNILSKIEWALLNIEFGSFESKVLLLRDSNYIILKK